jgi:hypothetical protein
MALKDTMELLRAIPTTIKLAVNQMAGDLMAMYAQGGFTAVLIGTLAGMVIYQLRSRGVSLPGDFRQL